MAEQWAPARFACVRKRFLEVSLSRSLIQVTLGGIIVAVTGVLIGNA